MQRLRRKASFPGLWLGLAEIRTFAASMPAWSRILLGSPVTGNPHSSCDRERRCAEQIRIAIVAIGDGIAQPMRSAVGDRCSFVGDLCHGVAGGVTGIVQHSGRPVSHRCSLVRDLRSGLPDRFARQAWLRIVSVPWFGIFVVEAHIGL
jgi:hypothetical protein